MRSITHSGNSFYYRLCVAKEIVLQPRIVLLIDYLMKAIVDTIMETQS